MVQTFRRLAYAAVRKLGQFTAIAIAFPFVVLFRCCSPIIKIRYGFFWVDRIGHFAFDIEYCLCELEKIVEKKRFLDLFYFERLPANEQLAQMVKRTMKVHPIIRYCFLASKLLPGAKKYQILPARIRNESRDKVGLFRLTSTQVGFEASEQEQGWEFLEEIGLSKSDRFVCLMVRDSAYLRVKDPDRDWSYHNFRDCDIRTYYDAAKILTEKGYWVFRMGKVVSTTMDIGNNMIVDYANMDIRSDFLDVWLMANCDFAISSGTGLDSVSDIFRRPVVYANYDVFPLMVTWSENITVPKKLVWSETGIELNLKEYFAFSYANLHKYEKNGLRVVDLSDQEITDAVLEMECRLSGNFQSSPEDVYLHERFWKEFERQPGYDRLHGVRHPDARIGNSYLRSSNSRLLSQ